jgi:hypothetical protein
MRCDLALDVAGLEVGQVTKRVVEVDAPHEALQAATWAAGQARPWLASLPMVQP